MMKRSEFIERATEGYGPHAAGLAAEVADEAGIPWDPEEPGLPERISQGGEGVGLWTHDAHMEPRDLTEAEEHEAAARYNAVASILTHDEGLIHTDHVKRVLRQERDRLP